MSTAITPVAKPEKLIVCDTSPESYLFDTARFEQCYRIASAMAKASLLPDHLTFDRKTKKEFPVEMIIGNCFMIVNQAVRWRMDPFALPSETYVVANKLGYQGKLIAAVINARAGLHSPLQCIYNSAKGDDMAAVVFGSQSPIPKDAWPKLAKYAESEDNEVFTDLLSIGVMCIRIRVGQAKTDNEMWRKDPAQKLFYSGATKWSRRHRPEIILGVLTDDDLDCMNAANINATSCGKNAMDEITAKLEAAESAPPMQLTPENSEELPPEETNYPETPEGSSDGGGLPNLPVVKHS